MGIPVPSPVGASRAARIPSPAPYILDKRLVVEPFDYQPRSIGNHRAERNLSCGVNVRHSAQVHHNSPALSSLPCLSPGGLEFRNRIASQFALNNQLPHLTVFVNCDLQHPAPVNQLAEGHIRGQSRTGRWIKLSRGENWGYGRGQKHEGASVPNRSARRLAECWQFGTCNFRFWIVDFRLGGSGLYTRSLVGSQAGCPGCGRWRAIPSFPIRY